MTDLDIAVVGLAGRWPRASSADELWHNILHGTICSTRFDEAQWRDAGLAGRGVADGVVAVRGVLDDVDRFDAAFFGYSPREAQAIDPQQRLFLQVAWSAMEDAGYAPDRAPGAVGVFASCSENTYLKTVLGQSLDADAWEDSMLLATGNQRDFIAARVSYKLGLSGPSMNVQTACSSSLVAVHLACQSLLSGESDMALAGGSAVRLPQVGGQRYVEGGVYSPDGTCRAYTTDAKGVYSGNAVAAVVLKRLEDAVADGDHVHAVIKASSVNNDGTGKIGFTAPSEAGQAAAMRTALQLAEVSAQEVGLVEGHGTGTPLGDRIELAALQQVYGRSSAAVGSVKSNIGHTDAAAGVTGLIKAVLALENGVLPPQPYVDEDGQAPAGLSLTGLQLRARSSAWRGPRYAAVNSLGLGGTNAHVVLGAGPDTPRAADDGPPRSVLLAVSADDDETLQVMLSNAVDDASSREAQGLPLRDLAATLLRGRSQRTRRATVVGRTSAELRRDLARRRVPKQRSARAGAGEVAFLYTGGGTQYARAATVQLRTDPAFRAHLESQAAAYRALVGHELIDQVLLAEGPGAEELRRDPVVSLASNFVLQLAVAGSLADRGVRPRWHLGYSLGEYTAATLSGTLQPDDALRLVVRRAQLLAPVRGGMLSVDASSEQVRQLGLLGSVSLAAVNTSAVCTLSGSEEDLRKAGETLASQGIDSRRVPIETPGHSALLDPVLAAFRDEVSRFRLEAPAVPWISNVTGREIEPAEATDPDYWVRHLRQTVQFSEAVDCLLGQGCTDFVEVGPGRTLGSFVREIGAGQAINTYSTLSLPHDSDADEDMLTACVGELWTAGWPLDVDLLHDAPMRRVPAKGQVFARERHWLDSREERVSRGESLFSHPSWTDLPICAPVPVSPARLHLVCPPEARAQLAERWSDLTPDVVLLEGLPTGGAASPAHLVLAPWGLDAPRHVRDASRLASLVAEALALVADAVEQCGPDGVHVTLLAHEQVSDVAALTAALRVQAQENPGLRWQVVQHDARALEEPARLLSELLQPPDETWRLLKDGERRQRALRPLELPDDAPARRPLQQGATYVFTGGLGRYSLAVARELCARSGARVVLTTRRSLVGPKEVSLAEPFAAAALSRLLAEHRSSVDVVQCDVTDPDDLTGLLDRIEGAGQRLGGVFHAAAATSAGSMRLLAADTRTHHVLEQLHPKLEGARALAAALAGRTFGFCFVFSSNASAFGGPGLSSYASANAAVEQFAVQQWKDGDRRWVAATWDGWRLEDEPSVWTGAELEQFALLEPVATDAVLRLASSSPTPVVVVSAAEVRQREDRWVTRPDREQEQAPPAAVEPVQGTFGTDAEARLAELWSEVLAVRTVSPDDNFFELGGHSLLGLRLVSRIKSAFEVDFDFGALQAHPVLNELAVEVEAAVARQPVAKPTPAAQQEPPPLTLTELLSRSRGD